MIRYHEPLKAALNTLMRLKEFNNPGKNFAEMFRKFLPVAMETIELTSLPEFNFVSHVESPGQPSFGQYIAQENVMYVALANRHPVDILRTIAHELVHYKQDTEHQLNIHSGDTGSLEENQAHQLAGIVMRHFNKMYPEYLEAKPIMMETWSTKYKRSIDCDNPKGFSQRAHCQGRKKNESSGDRGDIPTGPGEQLIPFPAGTTMIDVSDAYDWYKLGMVISDLDDADPKIFGQGAPHTAIVFGSEEEEHKLLPLLKRLGLSVHDIDTPQDVKKAIPAKALIQRMEENFAEDSLSAENKIAEIGYSDELGNLNLSNREIISSAVQDGSISQKPVMKFKQGNSTLFFFTDDDKISALVLLADKNKLKAIKNFSGQSGQVYALINYIVNIKNRKLVITPDEPLTNEGFKWIIKLIKNPTGLKVTDLDGNTIDVDQLTAEWRKSKSQRGVDSGDTSLVISESSLKWKHKLQENEKSIIPYIYFKLGKKKSIAEDSEECPPATQDIKLNLENRQKAIDEYGYGPLNPDLPNTKFWLKKVDEWNLDSADEAKQSLCGNCAAFDVRQKTLDCIATGIDSENSQDAEAVIDAGDLGYCKFLKFKCASRRTCDAWVTGGPLTDSGKSDQQGVSEGHNKAVISEAREAPLYHFTTWNNLIYIISGNELKSPGGKIYLTRDYSRQFIPHEGKLFKQPYGIRLNQDLLSRDYGKKLQAGGQDVGWNEKERQAWLSDPKNADEIEKIKRTGQGSGLQVRGVNSRDIVKGTITQTRRWESEEHLNVKSVPNVNKYITGIVIGEILGQEHSSLVVDADPLTKLADVLIHLFAGDKTFKQRDWLLDSATKLNVPIIYKRKEFDPIEVKKRIIQLYSQRKKEREEEKLKTKQNFMFITNKAGGGFMFDASDIPAAFRELSKDFKFKDRIIYGYSIGYDPKAEKTMFDKPGTPVELLKTLNVQKENFADGRNPQDKGDSARHGIRKGMTIAQLKKIRSSDTASARKKQLAHWQINMRQGKKKP